MIVFSDYRQTRTSHSIYGNLHDYIPFYFAPRSPMLYAIYQGKVERYANSQNQIIYVITRTDKILQAGLDYVFTDGHAVIGFSEFYKNFEYLDKFDWSVMKSRYWFDTEDDPDRKRRRQAEFLVYEIVPVKVFSGFAVKSKKMKNKVEQVFTEI